MHVSRMSNASSRETPFTNAYLRAAYSKAIFADLRRHVQSHLPTPGPIESPERPPIIAEDAPFNDRFVTHDALIRAIAALEGLEREAVEEMRQFEMVRRRPSPTTAPGRSRARGERRARP